MTPVGAADRTDAEQLVTYIEEAPADRLSAFANAIEAGELADDPACRQIATLVRRIAERRREHGQGAPLTA